MGWILDFFFLHLKMPPPSLWVPYANVRVATCLFNMYIAPTCVYLYTRGRITSNYKYLPKCVCSVKTVNDFLRGIHKHLKRAQFQSSISNLVHNTCCTGEF